MRRPRRGTSGYKVVIYSALMESTDTPASEPLQRAVDGFREAHGPCDVVAFIVRSGEADGLAARIQQKLGLAPVGLDQVHP